MVWSKTEGDDLKAIVTGRYSSATVFLSLLFSTEMGVIYSPSNPAERIRNALADRQTNTVEFWTGIVLCIAVSEEEERDEERGPALYHVVYWI